MLEYIHHSCFFTVEFLGAYATLRKAIIIFVMSVRLSVQMVQLGSHWTDFHEILYFSNFRKSVEKIQVFKNLTRMTSTLPADQYTFSSLLAQFFLE